MSAWSSTPPVAPSRPPADTDTVDVMREPSRDGVGVALRGVPDMTRGVTAAAVAGGADNWLSFSIDDTTASLFRINIKPRC